MKSGFDNNKYYVEYTSPGRPIGTFREELELSVKQISEQSGDKLLLSLSSGLDSQIILHSLHTQDLPYSCAFMHMPGYNDHEYENVKFLEKRYGFKSIVVVINPDEVKEEILKKVEQHEVLPNHLMHQKFLSMLPGDFDFLNGIEGPDIVTKQESEGRFLQEAYWNFENTRLRKFRELDRTGKILNLDRNENSEALLTSILQDQIMQGYVHSLDYIVNNDLVDASGSKPFIIFNWNYYVKPIIMGRYWGGELTYFSKSMGVEKVDWIINNQFRQSYHNNVVLIDYWKLLRFLTQSKKQTIRFTALKESASIKR